MLTGLQFSSQVDKSVSIKAQTRGQNPVGFATKRGASSGVRFTFMIYENQRRWLGIGWTYSLFPSERTAWTDEHLNSVPSRDEFELPDVHSGNAEWRWIEGSEWHIEGADEASEKADHKSSDGGGWVYYDNKWNDGRRGQDGWDRYTRRRKWYRDAELVEISSQSDDAGSPTTKTSNLTQALEKEQKSNTTATDDDDAASKTRRRRWFGNSKSVSGKSSSGPSSGAASSTTPNPKTTTTTTTSRSSSFLNKRKITSSAPKHSTSTSSPSSNPASTSRPINIRQSSTTSSVAPSSGSGSLSDTFSVRDKEIVNAQDRLDRWGSRATGGPERVERELGLSDEVNMGLS